MHVNVNCPFCGAKLRITENRRHRKVIACENKKCHFIVRTKMDFVRIEDLFLFVKGYENKGGSSWNLI